MSQNTGLIIERTWVYGRGIRLSTLAIEPFAYQGKIIFSGQAHEDSVTKLLKLGL